jgi:hypothetical protein
MSIDLKNDNLQKCLVKIKVTMDNLVVGKIYFLQIEEKKDPTQLREINILNDSFQSYQYFYHINGKKFNKDFEIVNNNGDVVLTSVSDSVVSDSVVSSSAVSESDVETEITPDINKEYYYYDGLDHNGNSKYTKGILESTKRVYEGRHQFSTEYKFKGVAEYKGSVYKLKTKMGGKTKFRRNHKRSSTRRYHK